jgi:hypothetical protein
MLTGYNTDVAYEGITYHVQTEDKGVETPVILSLVYQGGTILASKRTNYGDLVNDGSVDQERLAGMLEHQHRLIIAAIQSGKIEQLIKKSQEQAENSPPPAAEGKASKKSSRKAKASAAPPKAAPPKAEVREVAPSRTTYSGPLNLSLDQILEGYLRTEEPRERLGIELLTPARFVSGEQVTIRAAVLFSGRRPVDNAFVKLQVVGTAIKPQTFAARADASGVVTFALTLPQFASGTAALVMRAYEPKGQEAEVKYLIRRR